MSTKLKYLLIFFLALVYSCDTEEDLFPNCEFPYPITTVDSSPSNITREELPEEIVQYALRNYENITRMAGVVLDNCIREELLLVAIEVLEVEFDGGDSFIISEVHRLKHNILAYNSCGNLMGTGTLETASLNSNNNSGSDEFINSIANLIDEDIVRLGDIHEVDFDEDGLEYFVEVRIETNTGETADVFYFVNLEKMTFCIWE